MPLVTIPITREGTTPEQEAALDQGGGGPAGGRAEQAACVDLRGHPGSGNGGMGRGRTARGRAPELRPRPGHPVSRSDNAFSISLRRRATNSATGDARASGAPCPAHWAPYPNSPAAFAAACSAFPAS